MTGEKNRMKACTESSQNWKMVYVQVQKVHATVHSIMRQEFETWTLEKPQVTCFWVQIPDHFPMDDLLQPSEPEFPPLKIHIVEIWIQFKSEYKIPTSGPISSLCSKMTYTQRWLVVFKWFYEKYQVKGFFFKVLIFEDFTETWHS